MFDLHIKCAKNIQNGNRISTVRFFPKFRILNERFGRIQKQITENSELG